MNAALFEGAEVQLGAMLAAREARMAAQHGLRRLRTGKGMAVAHV